MKQLYLGFVLARRQLQSHRIFCASISNIDILSPNPLHPILQPVPNDRHAIIIGEPPQPFCLHLIHIARLPSCSLRFLRPWEAYCLIQLCPLIKIMLSCGPSDSKTIM